MAQGLTVDLLVLQRYTPMIEMRINKGPPITKAIIAPWWTFDREPFEAEGAGSERGGEAGLFTEGESEFDSFGVGAEESAVGEVLLTGRNGDVTDRGTGGGIGRYFWSPVPCSSRPWAAFSVWAAFLSKIEKQKQKHYVIKAQNSREIM